MNRISARRRAAVLLAVVALVTGGATVGLASPATAGPFTCCTKG